MMLWASSPQWYSCKPSVVWSVTYQGFTDWSWQTAGRIGRRFYVRKSVLFAFYIFVIIGRDNYPVCCIKSSRCQVCYWMLCHFCVRSYDIFQSYDIFLIANLIHYLDQSIMDQHLAQVWSKFGQNLPVSRVIQPIDLNQGSRINQSDS